MPSEEQCNTRFDEKLTESPVLDKNSHPVEYQENSKEIRHVLRRYYIIIVQEVVGGKGKRNTGKTGPAVFENLIECEIGQQPRSDEEQKHGYPCSLNLA